MQEHTDRHRSDSTRLPCQELHGACRKSAYCLITMEETASQLTEHHASVKMEYMQKQCVHLLRHFLLKPCAATADLCCCMTSMCYWCFSKHIVMEIWIVQFKPGHTCISSIKRQRILLHIVGRRPAHWKSVFLKHCWWFRRSCKHTAEWLSWLALLIAGQTSLVDAVPDRYKERFVRCHIHRSGLSCCEESVPQ
jgi:hypothetical protein